MAFEEPEDKQDLDVIIERSVFWGLWRQKICFDGKYSVLKEILDKFKWKK